MEKLSRSPEDGLGGVSPNGAGLRRFVESASASMRPVEGVVRELAQSDVSVLLLAERGAGKHATARRIHELSRRGTHPFRALGCAQLQPDQLQNNLQRNPQRDPENNLQNPQNATQFGEGSGTIYLEEVAELSGACQARLFESLTRAGEHGTDSRARLICGSAGELEKEVKAGRLREDLYYRISGVCLRLPPLRQRREDIPVLMEHFVSRYAEELQREAPVFDAEMQQILGEHAWPGNVRELEELARMVVALGDRYGSAEGLRELLNRADPGDNTRVSLKAVSKAASREAERELILKALTRTRWNRRRAAQELQISYKALLYKMKEIVCEGYGTT